MKYVQDRRIGLCFAYMREYKQFSLATVPCEKVPTGLLLALDIK
jgi:hypothetical protein